VSMFAQNGFVPPASGRVTYNFNPAWKFIKQDAPGAEASAFDDARWENVSTPHTWNDVDSYDEFIGRGGEKSLYMGPAWYRKHFKLPESARGSRVVIEFEGMRQAAKFWVNGKPVGKYEDGVTACGVDITDAVEFGDKENLLAVWITNATDYREEATGVGFQWASKDFNPNFGGINRNVRLHILPKIHQTLPLLNGLGTTGVYVYATDHDVPAKKAVLHIESQVRNRSGSQAAVDFSALVVDASGKVVAKLAGEPLDMVDGETAIATASGPLTDTRWWSPATPNLYSVYTILSVGGKVMDVEKVTTGFRKTEFKGGAGTGGVYINDQFTWLTGWAQRSTNEWAAIGAAYPDWMHDYDLKLMRETNGNYVRWMHIAPKRQLSDACDRVGLVQVCPAGDKEANPTNPIQWQQRVEVMRRTLVYFRNSPSILFWEAGNNGIPAARMKQMVELRKELDPSGGRVMGCRSLAASEKYTGWAADDPGVGPGEIDQNAQITEYFGVMLGQDAKGDKVLDPKNPTAIFRAFNFQRRDLAPVLETEAFREESLRTYWDNYSPPSFGFKKGPNDTWDLNSEQFCLAQVKSYNDFWSHRITLKDAKNARWSAYASIVWADSLQLGRNPDTETARTSGKVDGVRIPKQVFYAARVMQNVQTPDLHIIGHWTYPAETKKTIYVVASNVHGVELFVNERSLGKSTEPRDGFIYAFPDVAFSPGSIKAVGLDPAGKPLVQHALKTAGPAKAIKLTRYESPNGFSADGADIAFFDVEVVDADGNRCPTDQARVDFELTGPAIWRGGVNEFKPGSINHTYLDTECGINRIFIRSTLTPGNILLKAQRSGLESASIRVKAKPLAISNGLVRETP
ncbi:MAG: sugar-binding domain-containing protein, partial [Opitutaceae bacterium]